MRSVENDFSADRLFLSSNRKKTQGVKSINPRRDSQLDECAEKRGINSLSLYVAATYEDYVVMICVKTKVNGKECVISII